MSQHVNSLRTEQIYSFESRYFSNAFNWNQIFVYWFKFRSITFLRVLSAGNILDYARVWRHSKWQGQMTSQWRHNGYDGVSNHQPRHCLLNRLFGCRSKKTSKLRVTGLCARNSPGTGEFPAQMASNAENVSIWWRHHVKKHHTT